MLGMKLFIADIFAKIGSFFCLKAMWLAGKGHFDFEISHCSNPFLEYQKLQGTTYSYRTERTVKFILGILLLICMTWVGLRIAYAIESSGEKVVIELRKEHKDDTLYRKGFK